jgi:hypothetical protein
MATLSLALAYRTLPDGTYEVPKGGAVVYTDAAGKAAAIAALKTLRAQQGDLGVITMDAATFTVAAAPPNPNANVFIDANLKDTLALMNGLAALGPIGQHGYDLAKAAVDAWLAAGN